MATIVQEAQLGQSLGEGLEAEPLDWQAYQNTSFRLLVVSIHVLF